MEDKRLASFIERYNNGKKRPKIIVSFCVTPYNIIDVKKFAEKLVQ